MIKAFTQRHPFVLWLGLSLLFVIIQYLVGHSGHQVVPNVLRATDVVWGGIFFGLHRFVASLPLQDYQRIIGLGVLAGATAMSVLLDRYLQSLSRNRQKPFLIWLSVTIVVVNVVLAWLTT